MFYAVGVGAESLVSILKKYPERTENDIETLKHQMNQESDKKGQNRI